ncbi:hypothetical protein jhhlp_001203 [Lomentospora prolificans]|uniref:Thiamine phosphate synthase/TenI domain-containing protein n=1 Tax=Lomentospora prolificans TaxID=41688 RepID=A0A2N3NHG3_9PEZI|nr:hypothetical protein jhhlp_001203 [Lomentospora prolificans]
MGKPVVDYSLYLVTDSTPAILGSRNLVAVVEAAVKGGVTLVQYRDKTSDTRVLVDTARELHAVTKKYGVPLLINDRVDVALAVGCEGVHIGQDDMDLPTARKLLGEDKIIGVSASTIEEAQTACDQGADYLGLGAVFSTPTYHSSSRRHMKNPSKSNTKNVLGVSGLRALLSSLFSTHPSIKTVCIGGLNASNLQRVLYQSATDGKPADGVALVSAIVAAEDPEAESRKLLELVRAPPAFVRRAGLVSARVQDVEGVLGRVREVVTAVDETTPLSHNMTNLVVQNFAANVALAVGGSPIMANYGEEAADLAALGGALVVNMGTVTPDALENYAKALKAYNLAGGPVIFDPVGAGATSVRRNAVKAIMAAGYLDIIKGNEGEILTVDAVTSSSSKMHQQRGVDSSHTLSLEEKAALVRTVARRERNVVVCTGKTDVVSDGQRTFAVSNGHEMLGRVTGTGCVLGTTISAFAAAYGGDEGAPGSGGRGGDRLVAAVAALVLFGVAGERAAEREGVQGPGGFVPAFIDELYKVRKETVAGDLGWLKRARVEML